MANLCSYSWPGNVRELENEIMRASTFASGPIALEDLSPQIRSLGAASDAPATELDNLKIKQRVERLEKILVREALRRTNGNQTRTAKLLGLSRFGLQKKMARYAITQ
jgi:DNA-binding NtrC family response regulator